MGFVDLEVELQTLFSLGGTEALVHELREPVTLCQLGGRHCRFLFEKGDVELLRAPAGTGGACKGDHGLRKRGSGADLLVLVFDAKALALFLQEVDILVEGAPVEAVQTSVLFVALEEALGSRLLQLQHLADSGEGLFVS